MRETHTAAVRARVAICRLARARGVDAGVLAQVHDELAAEIRQFRVAARPAKAAHAAVGHQAGRPATARRRA